MYITLFRWLLLTTVMALLPVSILAVDSSGALDSSSLEACLKELSIPRSMNEYTQAVGKKLQSFGRPAVMPLIELLKSPDEMVRNNAGYTIAGMKDLLPEDLPALQNAMNSGNGWVPRAIGHIGTAEAFRVLVNDLRQKPQIQAQTTIALEKGGGKAIPFLLEAITCDSVCPSPEFTEAIAFVLGQMNAKALPAVEPLIGIAMDVSKPDELRLVSLDILKAIGPYAKESREDLHLLTKSSNQLLADSAKETLALIGDESAVPSLLIKLKNTENNSKLFVLREISALGKEGKAAGPKVVELVRAYHYSASAAAAETLGWIGYRESIPVLMAATKSQDWELAYSSAWSLGQLRAEVAREYLIQLRDTHWSYPVKMVAEKSLDLLDQPLPSFDAVRERKVIEHFNELERLVSMAPICKGEIDWHGEHLKLEDNRIWPISQSSEALPSFIPVNPFIVFRLENGWLIGVNHGEFCGNLIGGNLECGIHYFNTAGKHIHIADGHALGIYQTSNGLVFTEGSDHMMFRSGHVIKINLSKPDVWSTQNLAITLAAPQKVAVSSDGILIVQTFGSVVAVTKGGKLEAVDCLDENNSK